MNNHKRHLFSFCIELFQGPGGFWIAIHWPLVPTSCCFQGTRKPRNHMDPDQTNKWVKADVIADIIREVTKTWWWGLTLPSSYRILYFRLSCYWSIRLLRTRYSRQHLSFYLAQLSHSNDCLWYPLYIVQSRLSKPQLSSLRWRIFSAGCPPAGGRDWPMPHLWRLRTASVSFLFWSVWTIRCTLIYGLLARYRHQSSTNFRSVAAFEKLKRNYWALIGKKFFLFLLE